MDSLLPCPFCGGEAHTYRTMAQRYCAICNKPFCANVGPFDTEAEAIAAWNTQAERTCRNIHEYRDENGVLHRDARIFKCSECEFKANDFYGDDEESFPRFCPNCGAKVVSE